MKLSDKLLSERAEHLAKLVAINEGAKDRELDADEAAQFDGATRTIDELDSRIARERKREEATRGEDAVTVRDINGAEHLLLRSADKLIDRHKGVSRELLAEGGIGAAIKGIVTGEWGGRAGLQRALAEGSLAGGGYTVPAALAAQWLDLMRAKSVMLVAGTLTLPMDTMTLRVSGIASDPIPTSRKENTLINRSDPTFRGVDFKARSYGVLVTASLELISDSPNAEAMIEASLIGAMALAMDQASLRGDGATTGNLDNVLGLLNVPTLPAVPALTPPITSYDVFLDGIALVRSFNIEPNAAIMGVDVATSLGKLKTGISGDRSTLVAPAEYTALSKFSTTAMPAATAVVGKFDCGAIGLRESLIIEASREGDNAFQNAQVVIRALMRFDYQPLYIGAFAKMTGVAPSEDA